jgi:hypothetical protein
MMQKVQQRPISPFVNIAGNACAAVVSAILSIDAQHAIDIIATHRRRPKGRCPDSESGLLAIEKFLCLRPLRLIAARQKPNFWTNRLRPIRKSRFL